MEKVYNVKFFSKSIQISDLQALNQYYQRVIMDIERQAYDLNRELDFVQVKWGAFFRWSSTHYCLVWNTGQMTIGKTHPTLRELFKYNWYYKVTTQWYFWVEWKVDGRWTIVHLWRDWLFSLTNGQWPSPFRDVYFHFFATSTLDLIPSKSLVTMMWSKKSFQCTNLLFEILNENNESPWHFEVVLSDNTENSNKEQKRLQWYWRHRDVVSSLDCHRNSFCHQKIILPLFELCWIPIFTKWPEFDAQEVSWVGNHVVQWPKVTLESIYF